MINTYAPRTAPAPGKCLSCGTIDRTLVRFDAAQMWVGACLLCTQCLAYAVTLVPEVGMASRQEVENANKRAALAEARIDKFDDAIATFTESFQNALVTFNSELASISLPVSNDSDSDLGAEISEPGDSAESNVVDGESESSGSSDSEGPTSVPTDSFINF